MRVLQKSFTQALFKSLANGELASGLRTLEKK